MILIKENFEDGIMNYFLEKTGTDFIIKQPSNSIDNWCLMIPNKVSDDNHKVHRGQPLEFKRGHKYTFSLFAKGDSQAQLLMMFIDESSIDKPVLAQSGWIILKELYPNLPYVLEFTAEKDYPEGVVVFNIWNIHRNTPPSYIDNIEVSVEEV
ncbi:hypothetical protein M4D68_25530 [Priestia aryabhattai]|uniref:hypothetical protein n=1 Tax=Priestia aryabhattai TaxID=412384 RepID=UPI0020422279|nr:hypothetical protein [Priestia aryabhattai]MCM3644484.1 hypothetical protein [Priestia aryabhattai]